MPKEYKLIINSKAYKHSPYTKLTQSQQNALDSIVNSINYWQNQDEEKARPIVVCGDAGTGKSVLATSLFYYLKNQGSFANKKIGLVYANRATREEIGDVFKNTESLKKKDVISPIAVTKEHYDIIICDEAHRLRQGKNLGKYYVHFKKANERMRFDNTHNELDWIMAKSTYQFFLYDEKQRACPSDIPHDYFEQRLHSAFSPTRLIPLEDQMRIEAGDDYVDYIFNMLYQTNPQPLKFDNYDFKLYKSFADMKKHLDKKENEFGLCRYCSGYAWPWVSKENETYDIKDTPLKKWRIFRRYKVSF